MAGDIIARERITKSESSPALLGLLEMEKNQPCDELLEMGQKHAAAFSGSWWEMIKYSRPAAFRG